MVRLNRILDPTQTGQDADRLYSGLHNRIVGQDTAIAQVLNTYQTYLTGMNSPNRPVGTFLFLGPTGTGKTRLVEATAECLIGDARAVLKVDCAEFQHSHEIAKLIGSPPGYLGHRETHPLLSQETLNQHHTDKVKLSFILFDEIEKASDALWNLLLGILDKATLTLGDNRRVDFSRALIFMTSNLGASEMAAVGRPSVGFASGEAERLWSGGHVDEETSRKISQVGIEAARRKFAPEFMNRIDKTVVFKTLSQVDLDKILDLELHRLQQRILCSSTTASFGFELTEGAKAELLRAGTNVRYGARHLNRVIDRTLVCPLSNLIATQQIRDGDWVKVDYDPILKEMIFSREDEGIPAYVVREMTTQSPHLAKNLVSGVAIKRPEANAASS